jgi:hypothetical protein
VQGARGKCRAQFSPLSVPVLNPNRHVFTLALVWVSLGVDGRMKDFGYTCNAVNNQYDFNGMWMREDYAVEEYRHITALFLK